MEKCTNGCVESQHVKALSGKFDPQKDNFSKFLAQQTRSYDTEWPNMGLTEKNDNNNW